MAMIFACFIVLIICIYYVVEHIKYIENVRMVIREGKDLLLKDIILFSNEELARRVKESFNDCFRSVKIVYFNDNYITLKDTDTKKEIMKKLDEVQDILIEERHSDQPTVNSAIEDYIDEKMLDIWLDYGYNPRYRIIFKREMYYMLERDEISNSTFNRMYRRFYQFNRSEYEIPQ